MPNADLVPIEALSQRRSVGENAMKHAYVHVTNSVDFKRGGRCALGKFCQARPVFTSNFFRVQIRVLMPKLAEQS